MKKITYILAPLGILLLAAACNKVKAPESPAQTQTSVQQNSSASVNTYSNTKYALTFQYPENWYVIADDFGEGGNVLNLRFAKSDQGGSHNLASVSLISISVPQYYGNGQLTLDTEVNSLPSSQYTVKNLQDDKLGNNISAKTFDDGGGLFGPTYTTIAVNKNFSYIISITDTGDKEWQTAGDMIKKSFKFIQ